MSEVFLKTKPKVLLVRKNIEAKQIGIMGGTFNPIHNAHLLIADQVAKKLNLDEVWFVPDNIPPLKKVADKIDVNDRRTMIELAIAGNPKFSVKSFELKRGGISYTVDSLKYLKKAYPQYRFYLIMGSDQVAQFSKWKEPNTIATLATLVGVNRANYSANTNYPMIWVDCPSFAISSTLIRQNIKTKNSIRYLVPEAVREYIKKKGLYRE